MYTMWSGLSFTCFEVSDIAGGQGCAEAEEATIQEAVDDMVRQKYLEVAPEVARQVNPVVDRLEREREERFRRQGQPLQRKQKHGAAGGPGCNVGNQRINLWELKDCLSGSRSG
jgi:hypothetical protein